MTGARSLPAYQDGYRAAERVYKAREQEMLGQMVLLQRELATVHEHIEHLSDLLNNAIQERTPTP